MEYRSGVVSPVGSIEEGWRIIKDTYWTYFLMTLVMVVILFALSIILGLINNVITTLISRMLGFAAQNAGDIARTSAAIVPQLISIVISFFTNLIVATASGALLCGLFKALSRTANSNTTDFGDLFSGFQKILPCLIVSFVLSLIQFAIAIVVLLGGAAVGVSAFGMGIVTADGKLNPAVFGGLFLVIIVFLIFSIILRLLIFSLTAFVYPLIGDRDLSGGKALLVSAKAGLANIGRLILLGILLFLMTLGGALLCFVGLLFVAPVLAATMFAAYQSVFGNSGGGTFQAPPPPPVFNQY